MSVSEVEMSGNVRLRAFELADAPTLLGWIESEQSLVQWAGTRFPWPSRLEHLEDHGRAAVTADPPSTLLTGVDAAEAMVGYLELSRLDNRNRSAAISRVIVAPTRRNLGIARAMIVQALERGFVHHGLHRIELLVYSHNQAALRCYEALGFQIEGLSRDCTHVEGMYWSEYRMSLLEHEWRATRGRA